MKTYSVGEFISQLSEIIKRVRSGEEIVITYGKKKEKVAVFMPYAVFKPRKIQLGLLQNNSLKIHDDFKMTEEELTTWFIKAEDLSSAFNIDFVITLNYESEVPTSLHRFLN